MASIKILSGEKQEPPSSLKFDKHKCASNLPMLEAIQIWNRCEVLLEIKMEIWNIDDRIIKDKNHRKRAQAEKISTRLVE